MKQEDLIFKVDNGFGEEVECKIVSVKKYNDNEILVLFIDDERDEDNNVVLKYGKLIYENNEYELIRCKEKEELEELKKQFNKDLEELPSLILDNFI